MLFVLSLSLLLLLLAGWAFAVPSPAGCLRGFASASASGCGSGSDASSAAFCLLAALACLPFWIRWARRPRYAASSRIAQNPHTAAKPDAILIRLAMGAGPPPVPPPRQPPPGERGPQPGGPQGGGLGPGPDPSTFLEADRRGGVTWPGEQKADKVRVTLMSVCIKIHGVRSPRSGSASPSGARGGPRALV